MISVKQQVFIHLILHQNLAYSKYRVISTTPVKWQDRTISCQNNSYRLSIAEGSNSTPPVIFVPQNTSGLNALPGGSSVYLIIHTSQSNVASRNNPASLSAVPAPSADVEIVTVCEDQVVSTENSLVPVVSSVLPMQPLSVFSSNTSKAMALRLFQIFSMLLYFL